MLYTGQRVLHARFLFTSPPPSLSLSLSDSFALLHYHSCSSFSLDSWNLLGFSLCDFTRNLLLTFFVFYFKENFLVVIWYARRWNEKKRFWESTGNDIEIENDEWGAEEIKSEKNVGSGDCNMNRPSFIAASDRYWTYPLWGADSFAPSRRIPSGKYMLVYLHPSTTPISRGKSFTPCIPQLPSKFYPKGRGKPGKSKRGKKKDFRLTSRKG